MSFQINVPPSLVSKMAKNAEGEGEDEGGGVSGEKKREDWRKLKELEEARKAGTAPAMQDEEGKDINPHIPQYIMQAPWYYSAMTPTLRHQRVPGESIKTYSDMDSWYQKGVKEGKVATKFRKGACENCGAMTHKKKDCLERPRKLGAKFTGDQIAPDEHLQPDLDFDFEGKRDRWNGYDPNMHRKIIEDYQKLEEAKRELKAQNMDRDIATETEKTEDEEKAAHDDDEDKYVDEMDMPGQKFETKQRITVRNLRIREDTAKYLYNLDVNSAHYDPKTRSMRQNPFENTGKDTTEIPYAGDNFVRHSGDAHGMAKQQLFAWEAYEKGAEVHLQADPTKLEALATEYLRKKNEFKTNVKQNILDKYGGLEHLDAPPKQLLLAQTEDYVEYSRHGTVVKGQEKAKIKSHYEEDVHPQNHTSVWGSFWKDGQWGYKCCHSYIKESYCTGQAGVVTEQTSLVPLVDEPAKVIDPNVAEVKDPQVTETEVKDTEVGGLEEGEVVDASKLTSVSSRSSVNPMENLDPEEVQSIMEQYKERLAEAKKRKKRREKKKKKKRKAKKAKRESSSSSSSSEESEDEDVAKERRIKEAMAKEEERVKEIDRLMHVDERKRPYNVMYDLKPPTEEELEAFRRKQGRFDDPMAYLAGK